MYFIGVLILGTLTGMILRPTINLLLKIKLKDRENIALLEFKNTYYLCVVNLAGWSILYKLFGASLYLLVAGFILVATIILSIVDIKIRKIPNEMLLLVIVAGIVSHIIKAENLSIETHILGIITGLGIFTLGNVITGGKKVGSGDIKLAACIGFITGFPLVIPTLLIASIAVSAIGGLMILKGTISKDVPIPYAPFMMLGLMISMVVSGTNILT